MISDGPVAPDELHVSFLAFSGIEEDAVVIPPILVTVLLPALPGEQENEGPVPGRLDAPVPLTPKGFMDFRATVVDPADLEHS